MPQSEPFGQYELGLDSREDQIDEGGQMTKELSRALIITAALLCVLKKQQGASRVEFDVIRPTGFSVRSRTWTP